MAPRRLGGREGRLQVEAVKHGRVREGRQKLNGGVLRSVGGRLRSKLGPGCAVAVGIIVGVWWWRDWGEVGVAGAEGRAESTRIEGEESSNLILFYERI